MAHIAFFTPSSAGHLNPTLGVAAELVDRGHRVTYATTEDFAARVKEVGAGLVGYDESIGEEFRSFRFVGSNLIDSMAACYQETAAIYPVLRDAFDADRPDLVVCDNGAWWGRLLAAHWDVPVAQSCPMFAFNDHWSMSEKYTKLNPLHPRLFLLFARLTKLIRGLGVDMTPKTLVTGAGIGTRLVFLPREFQFAGDTFDGSFRFVGPCLRDRRFLGEWEHPGHDGPLLLCTLGTIYNTRPDFFRTVIEACADLPGHVVIAVGGGVDPADLGPRPAHIEVRSFVPQMKVLEHADLFVTHAGMGSTMESLYYGVPMLTVPQMSEEQANADRVVELGLGRTLAASDRSAERLRAEIDSMLADPTLRPRLQAMKNATRDSGGAPAAVAALEALLEGSS
ncbi:MAG: macrolide family glycosyltransferase [Actinocatenispora sp.]